MNNVNQVGPWGSITYTGNNIDPTTGLPTTYTQDTALSAPEQNLLNLTQTGQQIYGNTAVNQLGQVQGTLSQPFQNPSPGLMPAATGSAAGALSTANSVMNTPFINPAAGANAGALAGTGNALGVAANVANLPIDTNYGDIESNALNAGMNLLRPDINEQQETLNSNLTAQGITQGSAAWNNAQRQFGNQVGNLEDQTLLNAQNLTGQAIQQTGELRQIPLNAAETEAGIAGQLSGVGGNTFGQAVTTNQLPLQDAGAVSNQATNLANLGGQNISQSLAVRDQPINEASALLSGNMIQQPTMQNTPQTPVAPTDVIGAYQNAFGDQMANYNAQVQANSANLGGLYGLLGSGAMGAGMYFSDRRMKKDIERVGTTPGGTPVRSFHFRGEPAGAPKHVGVIAQELMKRQPSAVMKTPSGLYAVAYDKVR